MQNIQIPQHVSFIIIFKHTSSVWHVKIKGIY
jgi:hypothetical protein